MACMAEDRYAWHLTIENADGEDADLSGTAGDTHHLREALVRAIGEAVGTVDPHDTPVADDEDGWELRSDWQGQRKQGQGQK
jgi:hypothetical protein